MAISQASPAGRSFNKGMDKRMTKGRPEQSQTESVMKMNHEFIDKVDEHERYNRLNFKY